MGHFRAPKKSHFQSEAKCEAIDMKMIFNYDANKTHFHNKGFALGLVLRVRFFGTRKWAIYLVSENSLVRCCFESFLMPPFFLNSPEKLQLLHRIPLLHESSSLHRIAQTQLP